MSPTAVRSMKQQVNTFDGTMSYNLWAYKMQIYLQKKGLWNIIQGVEVPQASWEEPQMLEYLTRRTKALNAIVKHLADNQLVHVLHYEDPHQVWNIIKAYNERNSITEKMALHEAFLYFKFDSQNMIEHISNFEELVSRMRCAGLQPSQEELVLGFLRSLPQEYAMFMHAMRLTSSSINMAMLTSQVLSEETRLKSENKISDSTAMVTKSNKYENRECFKCGKKGHIAKYCRVPRKYWKTTKKVYKVADEDASIAFTVGHEESSDWIIDSGATQHMCMSREAFQNYRMIENESVRSAKRDIKIKVLGIGDIKIQVFNGKSYKQAILYDVLHVDHLLANLFSVMAINKKGFSTTFFKCGCTIKDKHGSIVAKGRKIGKLVYLQTKEVSIAATAIEETNHVQLWHRRLGHVAYDTIEKMAKDKIVDGLVIHGQQSKSYDCDVCQVSKQSKKPYPKNEAIRANKVGELVHSDIKGPIGLNPRIRFPFLLVF
jgi:gag-polypeptide of LTR copia-type/GAG-pre-integrase domain